VKTYGYNFWDKPKDKPDTVKILKKVQRRLAGGARVHILNAKKKHPLWIWDDVPNQRLMEVDPVAGNQFRVRVTGPTGQIEVFLPFKAFRALNHFGMPIAEKEKKK